MKVNFFLFVATAMLTCLLGASKAQAQRFNSAIEFSGGYAQEGFGLKASYDYFHNRTDLLQAAFLASFSEDRIHDDMKVKYSNYLLNLGYFTPVLKTRDNALNLFFGGGPSIGYERINGGQNDLSDGSLLNSQSGFLFGLTSGVNMEYFLSDPLSLSMPIDFYYHFGSQLGNVHFFVGLGIKYYIN